jgi:hypothetical protein
MKFGNVRHKIQFFLQKLNRPVGRIWGRNVLGKPSGILIDQKTRIANLSDEDRLNPEEVMASGVLENDLEYLTVPAEETYELLPEVSSDFSDPPDGIMFADVYEISEDGFRLIQRGDSVESLAGTIGGLNGPGIEFLYLDRSEHAYESQWGMDLPVFRDSMTPSLPESTLQGLFRYGRSESSTNVTQDSSSVNGSPKLKSAI